MKTFKNFKQQVAEKYKDEFNEPFCLSKHDLLEAIELYAYELYADYRAKEARKEAVQLNWMNTEFTEALNEARKEGWNEAIEKVLNEIQFLNIPKNVTIRISSLKNENTTRL